jgi:MFS family permease
MLQTLSMNIHIHPFSILCPMPERFQFMPIRQRGYGPFFILCLIGFATFFSSYLRIPVLPLFAASIGAGPAQVGIINGAFMLTAGLLSVPAGLLADRTGRKLPVIVGIGAAALSSLLVTRCHLPIQMAAAYVLFGAGLAAFAPGMLSLVADVIPGDRLGRAYGWYTTAIYVAMTLGPASGGYLAKHFGLRQVFEVSAALLTCIALVALVVLPRSSTHHRSDLRTILAASAGLLRSLPLLACLLATAGSCIGFGVFLTFMPLYAAGRGYDPGQVGLIFASQALTNVVGRVPIGMVADRVDRRLLVAAGLLALALALALMGVTVRLELLMGCSVLLGAGMALTFTAIGALIAELTPLPQRGLAMGMYNSCIYLGMMTGSTVLGLALKSVGYGIGFAAVGAVSLIALALFLVLMGRPVGGTGG